MPMEVLSMINGNLITYRVSAKKLHLFIEHWTLVS